MASNVPVSPKVFISYSHDSEGHKERALEFANRLRREGIDCRIDQYNDAPPEGWPRWMRNQIEESNLVLVVCTETYNRRFQGKEELGRGRGANWEGAIITLELYEAQGKNAKFIPIVTSSEAAVHIPSELRGVTYYDVSDEGGYDNLYRRLTDQPSVIAPVLGSIRHRPPRERRQNAPLASQAPSPSERPKSDAASTAGDTPPATTLQSDDVLALASRGSNHRLKRRYDEALADLNQVITLNRNDAWAIADRADVHRLTGRLSAALEDFNRAIRLEPNDAWALATRGETYRLLHLYRQALDDLNQAIQLEPNDAWAIACRGETYRLMQDYGKALEDLDLAIGLQPNGAWAIACRGETYRLLQRYSEAFANLNLAIDLQPDSAWAFACRGLAHWGLKQNEDALADFARAVELEPSNDEFGLLMDRL